MHRPPASHLICTVGTSLFHPNMARLPAPDDYGSWLGAQPPGDREHLTPDTVERISAAYQAGDWRTLGRRLAELPGDTRLLGAEINSITLLEQRGHVVDGATIHLLHSDTDIGLHTAQTLEAHYPGRCQLVRIDGLDDSDARRFRSEGLRNLARQLGRIIRDNGGTICAINATGGYKAQIAIAVVVGQVTGVPVYYKHERFSDIIALPPLPVSFDLTEWFQLNPVLSALSREDHPASMFDDDDISEAAESLIERVDVDGTEYLGLSPLGQVFHDTFRHRFQGDKRRFLPPDALPEEKRLPVLENAGWPGKHPEVERFLQEITDEIPQVTGCRTVHFNPDLSEWSHFRMRQGEITGIFSPGAYTVKFIVSTTASTDTERQAMVAELNEWIYGWDSDGYYDV